MIGRPEWFERSWGLKPRTWQGWLYIMAIPVAVLLINFVSGPLDPVIRFYISEMLCVVVLLDVFDITARMRKDEREYLHEAIVERNVARFMTASLILWMVWLELQMMWTGSTANMIPLTVVGAIIMGGAMVKFVSFRYLRDK